MSAARLVLGAVLVVIALTHAILGEVAILRPLLAAEWSVTMPRRVFDRILRVAWHLSTIALLGLAAIAFEVSPMVAIGLCCIAAAAALFVTVRTHLAWPLFLLAAAATLWVDGEPRAAVLQGVASATAVALAAAGVVHVYWAGGGRWMIEHAIPTNPHRAGREDGRNFHPGALPTMIVAVALVVFAGLVLATAFDLGPSFLRWLAASGGVVLALRAIGDGRLVGFTKKIRGTIFADADDRYLTPLVVFLALGVFAAVLT